MKNIDIFAIKGLTKKDDKAMMDCNRAAIEMTIDEFGRVYNEGGQYIANAEEVESGFGVGCNTHGGHRPGAGRKTSGRKNCSIYVTEDELIKVRSYIESIRAVD